MHIRSLGREDPLEQGMATHSSILAWRIPWRGAGGLQSVGVKRSWTRLRGWARGHQELLVHGLFTFTSAHTAPSLQVHGQKAAWEDPVEWVRDTLPWPSAQQDQSKLYHLPPPTVGPHSIASPPEDRTVKDSTPSSLDSDPLVSRGRCKLEVRVSQN